MKIIELAKNSCTSCSLVGRRTYIIGSRYSEISVQTLLTIIETDDRDIPKAFATLLYLPSVT